MHPDSDEAKALQKKIVFIGHPIGGDVKGNVERVLAICEKVHREGIIPAAPYLVSLHYLNDEVIEDRALGIEANYVCFERGLVDELWLFGDRISSGMEGEILLAVELGVPVVAKTKGTERDLQHLLAERKPLRPSSARP
jgi:hypothetical protein